MATYLVCETFTNLETISWDGVNYTLGTDAFNDIVTAELVASQDSPDPTNEIIVFAGDYTSSLNNFQNYEGITLNVTGVKYHEEDLADKAKVTLKTFKNNGIATFANAAFEATSVINNAGKTITLNGATFTADAVTNDGTFTIKGGATVNSTFTSTSIEKPGTIRLAGTINSKSAILGDNTISIASATTLDGATVVGGILDVKNHLTLKAATLTADTANITSGKYIIVDAGTSIINLDEVNFTGSTGITMKEGAFLTKSNIAGTVSVHTSATGVGATITGENTIEAILVPNKATAVKLNLSEANLTSDITVNGNGIVNALGENVVTGDITNNGVINVADGNSLGLNDGDLANAGTINLTGSITTTTTAQIANSGNIIVTGTGDLAAAVVMGDNGKVVFGTVDAAAETTFNGSITDIYNNPIPATYGKSTVQVLNGEVEFAKGSVVDIQGDAEDNRFTVGFRDAAIDPATVAATATVKGTVASHNGTWIGAAGAYDESFFDKKFFLIVDGGSYTNDANAFTVRGSGEVIVKNGGSLSITDAAIRSDITVTDSSMTFGSGNLYAEEGYTATIAITDSALTVNNEFKIGNSSNADRKGALVLDNATVDGTGKLNVTFAGSVSAVDTNIDVAEVANAGSFTVSGDSSISIGTLSGAIILDTASLTDSAIGTEAEFTAQSSLPASKQTGTSVIKTLSGTSTIDDSTIYVAGFHVGSYDAADAEAIGNTTVTISDTTLGVWMKTYHDDGPGGLFVGDATTDEVSDKKVKLEITEGSQVEARLVTVWQGASLVVSGEDTNLTVYEADVRGSDLEVKDGAEAVVELLDLGDSFKKPSFTTVSSGAKLSTILKNGADRRIRIREGATLTVNGAMIELDTADQTANSKVRIDADGTLTLEENSELKMGWFTKDSTWKKEAKTHYINVGAKGSITVTDSTFDAANETVTNNGSFTVSGTSTINIGTLSGNAIEVAAGSTLKDSTVGGAVALNRGETKFVGTNSINTLSLVDYDSSETATITVAKGDSLTTGRMSFGYNLAVGVTGGIVNALDSELVLTDDDVSFAATQGISFVGSGNNSITVKDAYIKLYGQATTPTSGASGNYNLSFTNSVADIQALKIYNRANLGNVNVTFDASKLNNTSHLTNESPKSTMIFKNGSVAVATGSFKNGGDFQVLSGSKFTANGVIQYGENSGNDGAITVDGKGSVMTLVNGNVASAFKSVEGASITVTNGGVFSANYVTNEGTITIDAASLLTGTELTNTGTITIDARNLAPESYAKVIDLTQASALTGVKVLGDAHAIYGADGDVVVTNISAKTLYVNSAWTINPDTEKAYEFGDVVGEGMVFGINAFSDIATMVSGITSVTNKIKFLEGGTYNLNGKAATISQSMTFETDGDEPTIWGGEFNLGTKNGTGDPETYVLNSDIYFFQFATNKNSPAVLTIDAKLSIAQGIWFKAGTKTTVTKDGSIQRIDQYPWEGSAEMQAGQFEVYGELTVNGTVNYFTQGATSYTFRIGNANEETYTGVLNVDGGKVHFMNNNHEDPNHPAYAPSLIDENGTVNLTNGGKLTVDQPLTNKGAITIDTTSLLTGTTLDNSTGTITIDARNLAADSYVKVIDLNQTSALTDVKVLGDAHAVYGADGDVVVTNITVTDLYVNSAWTGYGIGDPIEGETGKYYGINAFSAFKPAYDAVDDNGTITICSNVDGSGLADVTTKSLTFQGTGNIDLDKALQINGTWTVNSNANVGFEAGDWTNGLNIRSGGKLAVTGGATADVGYLINRGDIEVSDGATLKIYYGLLYGRKPKDGDASQITVDNAQIVFDSNTYNLEGHFGNTAAADGVTDVVLTNGKITALDTVTPGLVFDSTATLTATGTSEITAATKIENKGELNLSSTKLTAGTTLTNTGTINAYAGSTISATGLFTNDNEVVLVGTELTTNGIVNNASFKATDSVIDGGGQAGSPHITNGLGGTMELTNSIITTGAFIINSYGTSISLDNSTLNARIINSKEITAVDSTIISTDLRNEGGKFVVSGDSTLNVKLTNGMIDLENATLTATTVTGEGNLSIAAQYVVTPAVPAQGVEGEEGYVAGLDAVLDDNIVTFKGENTINAITNAGTLKIQTIPAVEAQGVEGEEGYVAGSDAVAGALTAGAITNNGTITIDATSSLSATSIAGGTIELTNFADNATRKVITVNSTDFTAAVVWTYGGKGYTLDGATTYTDDHKYLVQKSVTETATTISVVNVSEGLETLLVNDEWKSMSAGDVVTVGEKDYIIGYNAFANVDDVFALYADNEHINTVTKEVKFLSDVTSTGTGKNFFYSNVNVAFTAESDVTVDLSSHSRTYLMGYYLVENYAGKPTSVPTFTIDGNVTMKNKHLMAGQSVDYSSTDPNNNDFDEQGNPARDPGAANILVNGTIDGRLTSTQYSTVTTGKTGVIKGGTEATILRSMGVIDVIGDGEFNLNQFNPQYVSIQGGTLTLTDALGSFGTFQMLEAGDERDILVNTDSLVKLDNSKLTAGGFDFSDEAGKLLVTNKSEFIAGNGKNAASIVAEQESTATVGKLTNSGSITVTTGGLFSATALTNAGAITVGGEDVAAVGEVGDDDYKPAVAGAGSLTADTITNSGSIEVTNGSTLTATGIITNNGEFSATGSTILAKAPGFGFVNTETLTIDSSTVTVGGGAAILKNEGAKITIQNQSTVKAGLWNSASGIVTITESTVGTANAYVKNIGGKVEATDVVLKASSFENSGSYVIGGESTFTINNLNAGSITLADDAEISASTITESAEGTSVKVLADTEVTFVGTNSINAVIDNAGSLSADDLQVKGLINGIAATESTESVKGTITADNLTADSIVNNNGAGTNSGSSIELTGELIAGDIMNGVEAIADEAANNAEPGNKAFITAANITADSITNFGTIGSQNPTKTSIEEISLDGYLNNGKYGNVFATTLTAASIENDGEIVVNEIHAGSINNKASGENKPCGVIAVDTGSIVIEADEIINSGYIKTNGGSITATAITNNAYNAETKDGLIWTDSITADGTVTNYGKIDVDGTLTANRVVNSAGEFTVNGKSKIVKVSGVDKSGNVVVSGGTVTFNDDVTADNLNTQNASATININDATVSVAGKIYYSGTIVATDSVLDGIEFSGTGTMKVVNSSIDGIKLNHGTMQLDTMSLANVTIDGAFDVVGDSDFSDVNVVEGLTVSEGATLTISASATITSLTQPALTVTAGDLVNNGTITIDADGLEWGSTLKQLKVVSVTGADRKVINSGTITVENADNTMAIVQDDGIYLYYVKSSGDTKTLFVNEAWNYAPGYEWDYDAEHHLVFGVNAFQNADDIVFYTNTEALVFVGGNTTPYADLVWNKDDVSVTIDGGLTANFSDITLGAATLTGDITANNVTFNGDAVLNGTADVAALNIEKTLAMDWSNPIKAVTLNAAPASIITIDLSHDLETVGADTAVIATTNVTDFSTIVADYALNADIFKVVDGDLKLNAAAIGKVFSTSKEGDVYGYFTTVADAVSDEATTRILIESVASGTEENIYLNGKRTQVLASAGSNLITTKNTFAAGVDVSLLSATESVTSDCLKVVGTKKNPAAATNLTIDGGKFTGYVLGADMVKLATGEEEVEFHRFSDVNLTINGGTFAPKSAGADRAIAGGLMFAISGSDKTGSARIVGDINLTITGGSFKGYDIYGGNYANNSKFLGSKTSIKGDIVMTLDATENKLVFANNDNYNAGIVTAGSYGPSYVEGNTTVILTGDQGIEFEQLIGGCSGDMHTINEKTGKWDNESYVTGNRTLSFTGFSGNLAFNKIQDFNTVSFEGANEINFDGEFNRYFNDDVKSWYFADAEDTLASLSGSVVFDFSGDTINLEGCASGFELSFDNVKNGAEGIDLSKVVAGLDRSFVIDTEKSAYVLIG